jgi:hypothetical protein
MDLYLGESRGANDRFPTTEFVRVRILALAAVGTLAFLPLTVRAGAPPWNQQAEISASDAEPGAHFAQSVAISGNGTTAIVGAGDAVGAAYIYDVSAGWSQTTELTDSDAATFGSPVAIDSGGGVVLVGGTNSNDTAGVVYVFTLESGEWVQTGELADEQSVADGFGYSLALTGGIAIVGAPYADSNMGAAYIFTSNDGWKHRQELTASDGTPGDVFGDAVSLSLTGDAALVGAGGAQSGDGSGYMFTRGYPPGHQWLQTAEFNGDGGTAVAVSGNGKALMLATSDTDGGAQIWQLINGAWIYATTLGVAESQKAFGSSLALSKNGAVALIGADEDGGAGSAYVYAKSGTQWQQTGELTASGSEQLGWAVGLSSKGTIALIGAEDTNANTGSAYIFAK